MSHSLSNWLNHIKSDDIDDGLAADFDGSFSGLGSELGSNPYNMRLLMHVVFVGIVIIYIYTNGRVVQCQTFNREVTGSILTCGCCLPVPTLHAIPTGVA